MKVLHAAAEIAGQASILCRALRELGVDATALAYNAQYPVYPTDILLPYDGKPRVPRLLGYLKTAARFTGRYDLIHVHFGRGLVPPWNPDLPVHRALGTKLVFHFHGCDVRNRALMLARHASAACTECEPFCVPERQRRVIAQSRKYGATTYVSTPDLLESVPHAEHLPVALDVAAWAGPGAEAANRPRRRWIWVHHAPPAGSPLAWDGRRAWGDDQLSVWIERFTPDVVLAGHVHQAPFVPGGGWADRIGTTWVFNPGQQAGPAPACVEMVMTRDSSAGGFSGAAPAVPAK